MVPATSFSIQTPAIAPAAGQAKHHNVPPHRPAAPRRLRSVVASQQQAAAVTGQAAPPLLAPLEQQSRQLAGALSRRGTLLAALQAAAAAALAVSPAVAAAAEVSAALLGPACCTGCWLCLHLKAAARFRAPPTTYMYQNCVQEAKPVTVGAGQAYASIGEALKNTPSGGTIEVYGGQYRERLVVTQPVSIIAAPGAAVEVIWATTEPYQAAIECSGVQEAGAVLVRGLRVRHASPSIANNYAVKLSVSVYTFDAATHFQRLFGCEPCKLCIAQVATVRLSCLVWCGAPALSLHPSLDCPPLLCPCLPD